MKTLPVVYSPDGFLRHVCRRSDVASAFRIYREYGIKIIRKMIDNRKTYQYTVFGKEYTLTF